MELNSPLHAERILLVGLGSIGKRHLRNILSLGYGNVSVVSRSGKLPGEFTDLTCYTSVADALNASATEV